MRAHIVIEVEPDEYDRAVASPSLAVSVDEVTIRQAGGLFERSQPVLMIEGIPLATREQFGVDVTRPAVLIHVRTDQEVTVDADG